MIGGATDRYRPDAAAPVALDVDSAAATDTARR